MFSKLVLSGGSELINIREWITACRLISLAKSDGGIRPIAIGESFTRFVMRWVLSSINPQDHLRDDQFGVGSLGGTEPIIRSIDDSIKTSESDSIVSIDFSNAFNEVSREAMAKQVKEKLPQLYRVVKFLYGTPSQLLALDDTGRLHQIESSQGVRQGDPLGPLLFSITISPLLKSLEQFSNRQLGYLDDLVLFTNSGMKQTIVNHLKSADVFDRFNLRVNITKTQEFNTESLHHTPMKILGSYVGGTTNSQTNPTAVNFVRKAATRLQDRLDLLDPLTIQERLLLLRLCFFPVLGYLIRTMHPNLTLDGDVEFDHVVVGAIARWAGTVPENLLPTSVSIIHLPTKHGGLGLFQQQQIRKFAFSSSFVLCLSVLRARKIPLSSATYTDLSEFTKLCASNLDLPTDELLDDAQALCPHIQRRACDLLHERTWKTTYTALDTIGRLRFAEGTCPLARSWLQVFPI